MRYRRQRLKEDFCTTSPCTTVGITIKVRYIERTHKENHHALTFQPANSSRSKGGISLASPTPSKSQRRKKGISSRNPEYSIRYAKIMPSFATCYIIPGNAAFLRKYTLAYRTSPPTPSIAFLWRPSQLFGASALRCSTTLFICSLPARSWYAEAMSLSSRSRF